MLSLFIENIDIISFFLVIMVQTRVCFDEEDVEPQLFVARYMLDYWFWL